MSAAASNKTLSRQWELLNILPTRQPGISVTALYQKLLDLGFTMTRRTVERDLEALSNAFPLDFDPIDGVQHWRWIDSKKNALPGMTVAEAMMLEIVQGTLKTMLPAALFESLDRRFNQAKLKIRTLGDSNNNSVLADKIAVVSPSLPLTPPAVNVAFYDTVQQALTKGKQLAAMYTPMREQQQKAYMLNPLGLVQRGHISYLVATVDDYSDKLLFALHRFIDLQLTATTAKIPADFVLADYVTQGAMQFGSGKPISLTARVAPDLSRHLTETPIANDMTLTPQPDDWYQLTATVFDGWQLQWWILSHSHEIEVLAPAELRQKIIEKIRDAAALYPELAQV